MLCIPFMQDGMNALHLAAAGGHVKTIIYLASKMESTLQSTDHKGNTVLHWAAQKGHANVAKLLIEDYNLDPNVHYKVSLVYMSMCEHVCVCVCVCVCVSVCTCVHMCD